MLFFSTFYKSKDTEKVSRFKKNKEHYSKKYFERLISKLKWFLKDHVTLNSEVMTRNSFTGINYILKYIKRENGYFKL